MAYEVKIYASDHAGNETPRQALGSFVVNYNHPSFDCVNMQFITSYSSSPLTVNLDQTGKMLFSLTDNISSLTGNSYACGKYRFFGRKAGESSGDANVQINQLSGDNWEVEI